MKYELSPLPYPTHALEPHISAETLEYHHGSHHKNYVHKLNELVQGTAYNGMPLDDLIRQAAEGPILNNAAQIWNHDFYWKSLSPDGPGALGSLLEDGICASYGSLGDFKRAFEKECLELFGSGWVWLVQKPNGALAISALGDAGNPMRQGEKPLLVCDLWEHAFYIDHRNRKAAYLQAFWELVNWEFATANLGEALPHQRVIPPPYRRPSV